MEQAKISPRELRERKFLFRAPLFVAPVLIVLFKSFGGGRGNGAAGGEAVKQGFNTNVPQARLPKDSSWDKWTYYHQAQLDSLSKAERLKTEADFARRTGIDGENDSEASRGGEPVLAPDAHVVNVQQKLARLNKALAQAPMSMAGAAKPVQGYIESPDIARPEKIMGVLKKPEQPEDKELEQLNGVMDKLIAVQHPGRENDPAGKKVRASSPREAMSVQAVADSGASGTASMAVLVPEEQALVSGAELRMELAADVVVDGERIPGAARYTGSRI